MLLLSVGSSMWRNRVWSDAVAAGQSTATTIPVWTDLQALRHAADLRVQRQLLQLVRRALLPLHRRLHHLAAITDVLKLD